MAKQWTAETVLEMAWAYQPAAVLVAGAELGVFDVLTRGAMTAEALAAGLGADPAATTQLADALTAIELLVKDAGQYALAPGVAGVLTETGEASMLAMVRHSAGCLRSWAQLAMVTKTGRPEERPASIRGADADLAAFIEAMVEICRPLAPKLVAALGPLKFEHLLDVGGGPATWTIAFLRAVEGATATLFDRPPVLPIARGHIDAAGLGDRVTLTGGDFQADDALPSGADLAWVSAIVHQNSRQENRELLAKVHAALVGGGQVMIRDIVMDESRTHPPGGALFAVNMLVNTAGGGTFTFAELSEDLLAADFCDVQLLRTDEFMNADGNGMTDAFIQYAMPLVGQLPKTEYLGNYPKA